MASVYPKNFREARLVYSNTMRLSKVSLLVVFHSDDYISLFVPFLDVPEGLGSLLQRIASIDDRFQLSRLKELS
jgi:hypothetical protein